MSLDYAYVAYAFILHGVYPHGRNYSSVCCSFSSAPNFFFFFRQCKRHRFDPWGRKDVLEEETATHSSILAWKIPWTEEPGGLQSMGLQTSWTQLSMHTFLFLAVLGFVAAWVFP